MSHSKPPPGIHDEQFAALARHKDPQAILSAWKYRARLVLSVRRKFGDYIPFEDCEDLVTAAIVAAYERGATFDPSKSTLATWLNVHAHYQALEFLRRHSCMSLPIETFAELPAPELARAEKVAREVPSEYMRQALQKLPRVWARAIQLCYYEGLSTPLIAAEMKIAESSVRCYLARGIAKLSTILSMAEKEVDE